MADISVQPTPNPDSLKFTRKKGTFIESGLFSFSTAEEAARHPLGKALFDIQGVTNILILPDFLTVTKDPNSSWRPMQKVIEQTLADMLDERI